MSNSFDELQQSGFFLEDTRDMPAIRPERVSYYEPKIHKKQVSMITQLVWIFSRFLIHLKRSPGEFLLFVVTETVIGLLQGSTFYMRGRLPFDSYAVRKRIGVFVCVFYLILACKPMIYVLKLLFFYRI